MNLILWRTLKIPMNLMAVLILPTIFVDFGCERPSTPKPVAAGPAATKPTPTEVFNLRTKCAELGERINGEYAFAVTPAPVPLLKQEYASHYDPKTNRCYVEIHVEPSVELLLLLSKGNLKARTTNATFLDHYDLDFTERHLYDGQTGEELAFMQKGVRGVRPVGTIKGRFGGTTWADAADEIDDRMADDRKR